MTDQTSIVDLLPGQVLDIRTPRGMRVTYPDGKQSPKRILTRDLGTWVDPTPEPPEPPPSGPAFGSRPVSGPLEFSGKTGLVEVSNKTFRGAAKTSMPWAHLRFTYCTNVDIWVHDCDFDALDWDAIDILACSGRIRIENCRLSPFVRNPAHGQPGVRFGADFIQLADNTRVTGYIRGNRIKAGNETEDIINTHKSGGVSASERLEIDHNAFEGGPANTAILSTSGTGSLLSDDTNVGHINYHHNSLLNTGQVGVGISMGTDNHVTDNVIYGARRANSNVGIYTPYVAGSPNPGGHEVARNRVFWLKADGNPNPAWNGGASGTIAGWDTNVWQDTTIDPAALAVVL